MLHEESKERVKEGRANGIGLLKLFEDLALDANDCGMDALDLIVTYISPEDDFKVGTYVPELHLIVRKVTDD